MSRGRRARRDPPVTTVLLSVVDRHPQMNSRPEHPHRHVMARGGVGEAVVTGGHRRAPRASPATWPPLGRRRPRSRRLPAFAGGPVVVIMHIGPPEAFPRLEPGPLEPDALGDGVELGRVDLVTEQVRPPGSATTAAAWVIDGGGDADVVNVDGHHLIATRTTTQLASSAAWRHHLARPGPAGSRRSPTTTPPVACTTASRRAPRLAKCAASLPR